MIRQYLRILAACWALLFVGIVAGIIYPKFITWIPHRELLRPLLILFLLLSLICGLIAVFREGMKSARRDD